MAALLALASSVTVSMNSSISAHSWASGGRSSRWSIHSENVSDPMSGSYSFMGGAMPET